MAGAQTAHRAGIDDTIRARILADPASLLDDPDIMRALVAANERTMGSNIVDLRGMAMERLEARLDRLEETHRAVIAVDYENLASTNQIHRAILRMMDPDGFEGFLRLLGTEVADILRIDSIRLVFESEQPAAAATLGKLGPVLRVLPPGTVAAHMDGGRAAGRTVVLRQGVPTDETIHGARAADIRSEALMRLELGAGRLPGMLVMGSEDPHQFKPNQGTDLLAFFAGVFERALRRWLS
jgi:uncharacterized protein YigA (DUF484 family)